jgi:hypothetical protein
MKQALGISAFGLKDCVAQAGAGCHESGFYLADAVLPLHPFGRIRTGSDVADGRIHAGLSWPPEAQIQSGQSLRRAPISYVWRALVEAGDRNMRWSVGQGVSFPLPRILAWHVASLIVNGTTDPALSQDINVPSHAQAILPVVAIPNTLDEFGQEALLRELGKVGLTEAMLVWRPVAAALSWLDKVEGDFPRRMGEDDHIHVIYLGPDALEFTTFRLRVKEHNNQLYVLPLRDRPEHLPQLTGMDWAGRLIEKTCRDIEHGAFWQAFTHFPEIWKAVAGQAWNQEELPRAWSQKHGWTLWNPSPEIYNQIYNVTADPCDTLREILRASCRLNSRAEASSESMDKALRNEVRRMSEILAGGRLRGMIVCGPLVPHEVPPWLDAELAALSARGLDVDGELSEPEAGRLWLCTDNDDPVAEGATIYGQRTLAEIPSYLDTMPQVSILAQGQGQYTWVPLLNAQEVLGGTEFKDTIRGRFQLDRGRRELHVYLYKGPLENAPSEQDDTFDAQTLPFEGIAPCQARLVREVIRKLGSVEAVGQRSFFHSNANLARYGLAFAEAFFEGKESQNDKTPEPSAGEMVQTPFRRAVFSFPLAPAQDVVLDVEVRMRPASGLARVELVPKDASFLQGHKVRLNYATMHGAVRLPRRQRGWPSIQELVVDPNDKLLKEGRHHIEKFERTLPTDNNYESITNNIRDMVLKRAAQTSIANFELWVHAIDEDGQACTSEGNDIIKRIANKFECDFQSLESFQKDKVFSRAAWLYTSTPQNIVTYVRGILIGDFLRREWMWAIEAASRIFASEEDFRILFKAIAGRAGRNIAGTRPFPIQAARAICRVLMFRKNGEKGLDRNMAQLFAQRAMEGLQEQQGAQNFRTLYFQLIRLLLYLLRYRRTDPACFDPNSLQSIGVFLEAIESMVEAKRYFAKTGGFGKARQIQEIIEGFENHLHYKGTEHFLTVLGDLAGDRDT